METISLLKNTIQDYAWGSSTAIPELLGKNPISNKPQAELWMGAHPKAPSLAKCDGKWISLLELIEKDPKNILGKKVAEKFDNRLPYLFKVLAAAKTLSIQAHPSLSQAREGFEKENKLKIPLNAPNRNYKDNNHKPECICALKPFWALKGFRKISSILAFMEKVCPQNLGKELDDLRQNRNFQGLKTFFNALMTMDRERQSRIIKEAIITAQKLGEDDPAFKWMLNLHNEYPEDIGVLFPLLLNLIYLKPGQAIFIPAGELHSYLDGIGIELMANSDNVLRGGLTSKHVDVPELMRVLSFEEKQANMISPHPKGDGESIYPSSAEEFILSIVSLKEGMVYNSPTRRSVEILICTAGEATITDPGQNGRLSIGKGTSIIIPAAVKKYRIEGNAALYKAAVPV